LMIVWSVMFGSFALFVISAASSWWNGLNINSSSKRTEFQHKNQ
jgi:hypothetical protein